MPPCICVIFLNFGDIRCKVGRFFTTFSAASRADLFAVESLVAHHLQQTQSLTVQKAAWYIKPLPTFADALASVRYHLWRHTETFCMSTDHSDIEKIPRAFVDRLVNSLCYAA